MLRFKVIYCDCSIILFIVVCTKITMDFFFMKDIFEPKFLT